jgi:membrane protein involved in colicin uptake
MKWIRAQPEATKNAWLAALLAEPGSAARAEILAKYRTERGVPSWPTGKPTRTVAQLQAAATEIANESRQKAAEKAALERANRLAEMAAEPEATLRETQRLVAERTAEAYSRIADLLADLREALSGSKRADLAENHAQKLKAANPTLRLLTRELRRRGFVPK